MNLYSTGLRAVTKRDWKFWVEAQQGVGKAAVWGEEDVCPPNIHLRNIAKFTAVDDECNDIDDSLSFGMCKVEESTPSSGVFDRIYDVTFEKSGVSNFDDVEVGDTVVVGQHVTSVASVESSTTLIVSPAIPYTFTEDIFYHISRNDPMLSRDIIDKMVDYRTITVFRMYEPPIVVPIDITVQLEVIQGFIPSTVLSDVETILTNHFHPTYFDFDTYIAKSEFWDVVCDTLGVKTSTIAWTIDGVVTDSDYWYPPAVVDPTSTKQVEEKMRTIPKVVGITVELYEAP